jgi:hypothetical protein
MLRYLPSPDTIAEWPHRMFRVKCDWCRRYGQYRTVKLVAKFGTAASPVTIAAHLAQCPNSRNLMKPRKMGRQSCGLYFPDYVDRSTRVPPWRDGYDR